jgi:hypothetical protein
VKKETKRKDVEEMKIWRMNRNEIEKNGNEEREQRVKCMFR